MKPCRDCGQPASSQARSCPHCGILNPVQQWVSFPDGSHLTHREPVRAGAAFAAPAAAAFAPAPGFAPSAGFAPGGGYGATATLPSNTATLPGAAMPAEGGFGGDRLASWAIWAILFQVISFFFIGGLIGGGIAGLIAYPIGSRLPTRDDGRKLPQMLSIGLIVLAVGIFGFRIWLASLPVE